MEITCYYTGPPSVDGDQFQDHVVAEGAGRLKFIGHIPHRFVNVNNNKPSAVGIHGCLPPSRTAR